MHSGGKQASWLAILLLAALVSAGCSGTGTAEEGEATSPPLDTPSGTIAESPIPTPEPGLPEWDAQPAPGTANLRGHIVVADQTILLGELFLAKAVPTDKPEVSLLELDEKTAPRATINRATGEFVFVDIEPGKYGLIVWEPMSSAPVNDPKTGQTLYIELVADEATDIGTLNYP